jgi:uncharacterized lipoprotein
VLLVLALGALSLDSCSIFHRNGKHDCHEPQVAKSAGALPPLQVPAGLDAPDTRNAIRVPDLATPATPRSPTDPCLSVPPSFKSPG